MDAVELEVRAGEEACQHCDCKLALGRLPDPGSPCDCHVVARFFLGGLGRLSS